MNLLMVAMATGGAHGGPAGLVGDSAAFFLFFSGAVSLMIAGYLLYKGPKAQAQPVRYTRRH
jgi:hypothetical protein